MLICVLMYDNLKDIFTPPTEGSAVQWHRLTREPAPSFGLEFYVLIYLILFYNHIICITPIKSSD